MNLPTEPMKPSLQLKLGQHLTMTPQLQQAIRLLQLSTLELQSEIQQALEENPMLEQDEDSYESTEDENDPESKSLDKQDSKNEINTENEDPHLDMENRQEMPDDLAVDSSWEDTYDITTATASSNQQSSDSNNDFLENQSIEGDTLSEHLIWQLKNSQFSDNDLIIAIAVIDAVNDDGYLTESVEEIFDGLKNELDIEIDEVETVLHRIQRFDPVGIAARDLRECLLLQLEPFDPLTPGLADVKNILEHHLDLLGAHDYARLQKKTRRNEEQLHQLILFIQALNPKPGASISRNNAQYVVPDIFVRKKQWQMVCQP